VGGLELMAGGGKGIVEVSLVVDGVDELRAEGGDFFAKVGVVLRTCGPGLGIGTQRAVTRVGKGAHFIVD
jgi:hypothetical protein